MKKLTFLLFLFGFLYIAFLPNNAHAANVATNLNVTQSACSGGSIPVTFTWLPADNPAASGSTSIPVVRQDLVFSLRSDFSASYTQVIDVGVGTSSRSLSNFLPSTTYYWYINTSYYPGGTGSWSTSASRQFTTGSCGGSGGGGGGGTTPLGTIDPPGSIPNPPDVNSFAEGIVRNGIRILLVVSFLAMLLWTIFAGFRFVTSGGDEKTISQAWSSIYYGIIGMIVVMSSFALVRLVEIFFNVNIVSGGLQLPGP